MKKFDHTFFQNRDCEYFPCHGGVSEEEFNCLFCYCPLYCLGDKCGGDFSYTEKGIKNCKTCSKPHRAGGYEYVRFKFDDIREVIKKLKKKAGDSCHSERSEESLKIDAINMF